MGPDDVVAATMAPTGAALSSKWRWFATPG